MRDERTRQRHGTLRYLVNEYQTEMRAVLEPYIVSTPTRPMSDAIAEVKARYQQRCKAHGIPWSEVEDILDAQVGYSTSRLKRLHID